MIQPVIPEENLALVSVATSGAPPVEEERDGGSERGKEVRLWH